MRSDVFYRYVKVFSHTVCVPPLCLQHQMASLLSELWRGACMLMNRGAVCMCACVSVRVSLQCLSHWVWANSLPKSHFYVNVWRRIAKVKYFLRSGESVLSFIRTFQSCSSWNLFCLLENQAALQENTNVQSYWNVFGARCFLVLWIVAVSNKNCLNTRFKMAATANWLHMNKLAAAQSL